MIRIPIIAGFGGVSSAGRSSFHHGYRRLVINELGADKVNSTYLSLAALMKLSDISAADQQQYILDHTLVRQIEEEAFNTSDVRWNKRIPVSMCNGESASFVTQARNLPKHIPLEWKIDTLPDKMVRVDINGPNELLLPSFREALVKAAGQLPTGFNPGTLYPARSHPRGIQLAVYGASDAIQSMGVPWEDICRLVPPDQVSVYAGSAMGQLDQDGHGGMLGARFNDKRTTSKHCALGLSEMPADFINAYVLGSMGNTGSYVGACATFLYNLRQGVSDIQNGVARVVVVGSSEAPITSDVMDGYTAMGALATDQSLLELDLEHGVTTANYRRAVRPFSTNCGFTIAESSQYVVLMDDELAIKTGANILGAVTDVFVNADGYKKSIASPGIGNYLTMAKAMASARALLGDESIRHRSFVQAHGTSTPQNRVTESLILNETAKVFGVEKWPVSAVKAYLGHSLGAAAGDQLMATLGVWSDGFIPGIVTIDHVAEDVFDSNLLLSSKHIEVGAEGTDSAILNAKGFGGNNASGVVIAPHIVKKMLSKKHCATTMKDYLQCNESVLARSLAYNDEANKGEALPIYQFGYNVLDGDDVDVSSSKISVPGYDQSIDLEFSSPYKQFL